MKLETLYKRTKTGKIQYWKVHTNNGWIHKESGQLGTDSPVRHQELAEAKNVGKKNEISYTEQATLQAQSDWKSKKDEGYKTLNDLKIIIVGPNDEDMKKHWDEAAYVDYRKRLTELLEENLPQFNTDASGELKPQLAPTKGFIKGKHKYPKILEKKLDGNRITCKLVTKEENGNAHHRVTLLSRSGKEITTLNHIKAVLAAHLTKLPVGNRVIILDGEVYKHGWTLEEIGQAVKKYRPGITEQLEYWLFDMPLRIGEQDERSEAVKGFVQDVNHSLIHFEPGIIVHSDDEVMEHHDKWVLDGFEGGMLKDPAGTYEPGQRSRFWTKVKMFDDTEFKVIGHKLGQRGVEDIMFICEAPGGEFDVKLTGSRELKQQIYDEYVVTGKHIGKLFTVKHFGYTKYNIPYLPTGRSLRAD